MCEGHKENLEIVGYAKNKAQEVGMLGEEGSQSTGSHTNVFDHHSASRVERKRS